MRTELISSRFGNFIGDDVESDEASETGVDATDYAFDDEPEHSASRVTGQELMEIDGMFLHPK